MTYIGNLVWPMFAIGVLFNVIERGRASYSRVEKLLAQKAESKISEGTLKMPKEGQLLLILKVLLIQMRMKGAIWRKFNLI